MYIQEKIQAYYREAVGEHHRYRSWEHCYGYFRKHKVQGLGVERDQAALQLAFYLASWGMYRGSSFLLKHSYTVHRGVIDLIAEQRFMGLWNADIGARDEDGKFMPVISQLVEGIRKSIQTVRSGYRIRSTYRHIDYKSRVRDVRLSARLRSVFYRGV